ncbi:hypothetical protein GGS23DRAFT_565291 [Durotheca rogersii]|uniref:uncharacterized protein n=1 Tax=Durotheca rogersii TaxID=419775 RepID=UPI00221FC58C|nr:uncharacterized protein GGS23DRAFT_565291 [Durotheca rogersii]KAI5863777.1 hypothetical protein GGS23DRAFT_565291 [Durotheca rogersii]
MRTLGVSHVVARAIPALLPFSSAGRLCSGFVPYRRTPNCEGCKGGMRRRGGGTWSVLCVVRYCLVYPISASA